jgi:hypothetical protein
MVFHSKPATQVHTAQEQSNCGNFTSLAFDKAGKLPFHGGTHQNRMKTLGGAQ